METLDQRSPYVGKLSRCFKNAMRARRAHDTLIEAYCEAPSEAAWKRLAYCDRVRGALNDQLNIIESRHNEWIMGQIKTDLEAMK